MREKVGKFLVLGSGPVTVNLISGGGGGPDPPPILGRSQKVCILFDKKCQFIQFERTKSLPAFDQNLLPSTRNQQRNHVYTR